MKCECGKQIEYNHHYECYDCDCGNCYSVFGYPLAPLHHWQNEYDNEDEYDFYREEY